jgi:hypothetical protein
MNAGAMINQLNCLGGESPEFAVLDVFVVGLKWPAAYSTGALLCFKLLHVLSDDPEF